MNWLLARVQAEPVYAQGVVQGAVILVTAFGLHLDSYQVGAISLFSAAVLTFLTRTQVTPNAKAPGQ